MRNSGAIITLFMVIQYLIIFFTIKEIEHTHFLFIGFLWVIVPTLITSFLTKYIWDTIKQKNFEHKLHYLFINPILSGDVLENLVKIFPKSKIQYIYMDGEYYVYEVRYDTEVKIYLSYEMQDKYDNLGPFQFKLKRIEDKCNYKPKSQYCMERESPLITDLNSLE